MEDYNSKYVKIIAAKYLVKLFDGVDTSEKIIKKLAQKGENILTLGAMGNQVENEELKYTKVNKDKEKEKVKVNLEEISAKLDSLDTNHLNEIKEKLQMMENSNDEGK